MGGMLLSVWCSQSGCGRLVLCCRLSPPSSGDKALPRFLSSCLQVEGMTAGTTTVHWLVTEMCSTDCFTLSSSWNWRNWKPSLNCPLLPDRSHEQIAIFLTQNPTPKNIQTTHDEWQQRLMSYLLSWFVRPQAHFRSLTLKNKTTKNWMHV